MVGVHNHGHYGPDDVVLLFHVHLQVVQKAEDSLDKLVGPVVVADMAHKD